MVWRSVPLNICQNVVSLQSKWIEDQEQKKIESRKRMKAAHLSVFGTPCLVHSPLVPIPKKVFQFLDSSFLSRSCNETLRVLSWHERSWKQVTWKILKDFEKTYVWSFQSVVSPLSTFRLSWALCRLQYQELSLPPVLSWEAKQPVNKTYKKTMYQNHSKTNKTQFNPANLSRTKVLMLGAFVTRRRRTIVATAAAI